LRAFRFAGADGIADIHDPVLVLDYADPVIVES